MVLFLAPGLRALSVIAARRLSVVLSQRTKQRLFGDPLDARVQISGRLGSCCTYHSSPRVGFESLMRYNMTCYLNVFIPAVLNQTGKQIK